MRAKLMFATTLAWLPVAAVAAETVTYQYDAKGRLVQVAHSGSVNNGVTVTYSLDHADNRVNVAATGAP